MYTAKLKQTSNPPPNRGLNKLKAACKNLFNCSIVSSRNRLVSFCSMTPVKDLMIQDNYSSSSHHIKLHTSRQRKGRQV